MSRGGAPISERLCTLGRLLLILGGGVALLLPAQGQTPPAASKLRILSVSTPPLTDAQLPEGGLVLALVNASLARLQPGTAPRIEVRWAQGGLTQEALSDPSADLFLPVESADCDHPNELTHDSAVICDHAVFSEPILQVVVGLFSLTTSTFKFDADDSILGKTLCVSREQDLSALNGNGRNWASYKRINVLRRRTLLDCVVAVQAHEADAFTAVDLEGAYLLKRLGLAPYFAMQARPLATRGVHAVVWREHPRAPEILGAFNRGLKLLKPDVYAGIIQKHLMPAAPPETTMGRRPPPVPLRQVALQPASPKRPATPPPPSPSQGQAEARAQTTAPPTLPPSSASKPAVPQAIATASPPRVAAATASESIPVLDTASRERALRYLKRGDEELAEGRIAPARLLYERAAEMGLAQAAMALAATYDAAELNKPHLLTIPPDPGEAKRWYERARRLGATEAGARLQRLGSSNR
ncbi:MAG TPA: hypothetical protein VFY92_00550 [Hyphomicrobiaceae bacterium]|nr:hypothetical protein [Hyphomicrobiaceae bacterium]